MTKLEKYFPHLWIIILALIAIYIRVNGANYYHYSEDESMHFGIASAKSLLQVLQFSLYETHPPILYILLHYWLMISNQIWFVRCFSLIFGIALIPIYYKIGKKLGGEFTGLCCATLIVFSPICITQSYVLRHYAIMSFLLGITFYLYLLWRDEFKNKQLILYFIFATLACLTDFSAIFTIFVIASYETINLFIQRIASPRKYKWIATNILVSIILLTAYVIWKSGIDALSPMLPNDDETNKWFVSATYFYIPLVLGGILPSYILMFLLFVFIVIIFATKNYKIIKFPLYLSLLAFFVGTALHYTRIYPVGGGARHWSWLLTFILPLSASIISGVFQIIIQSDRNKSIFNNISILLFIIIGLINYNSHVRFNDFVEYAISQDNWIRLTNYVNNINNKSILVLERDDAVLLNQNNPYFNIFAFLNKDLEFNKQNLVTIAPYNNSSSLFSQYYRRLVNKQMFIEIFDEAIKRNLLTNYDNIIFMETKFTGLHVKTSPIQMLFLCPELDKSITYLSDNKPELLNKNIYNFDVLFMTVSKKDFIEQVLSPTGKATVCLDRAIEKKND